MNKSNDKKSNAVSTFAGAGSGTLLVTIVQAMPESNVKKYLIIAAPTISVGVIYLVNYIRLSIDTYFNNKDKKIIEEKLNSSFEEAIKNIDEFLKDPYITDEHRRNLIQQKEEIQQKRTEVDLNKIKSLEIMNTYVNDKLVRVKKSNTLFEKIKLDN